MKHIIKAMMLVMLMAQIVEAKSVEEGAFLNSFTDEKFCFLKEDMGKMQLPVWLEYMKSRGHQCEVTESEGQRWTALCEEKEYKLSFSNFGNNLMMDCKISDGSGTIEMKKGFLGEYLGACQQGMPRVVIEEYFDLPSSASDTASVQAKESVGRDLIYCGNVYHALSTKVVASKREALMQLGDAFSQEGGKLFGSNIDKARKEMETSANTVANEVVGASPEKMLALSQSEQCKPFLQGDFDKAVSRLIVERDKLLGNK